MAFLKGFTQLVLAWLFFQADFKTIIIGFLLNRDKEIYGSQGYHASVNTISLTSETLRP